MNLEKILEKFGLTKKQAKLYLTCLELGSASVYKISQKVKLPRSSVYELMEELKDKGLVSTYKKKNVKHYSAENPNKVIHHTREKIKEFEKSLPYFQKIYKKATAKPTVRVYYDVQGMKIVLEELLVEAKEFVAFSSPDEIFNALGDYWLDFMSNRIAKKIPNKIIINGLPGAQEFKRLNSEPFIGRVKIMPVQYKYYGLIMIWGKKIAMFSPGKEKTTLVIESEELANTQKKIFNCIWTVLSYE